MIRIRMLLCLGLMACLLTNPARSFAEAFPEATASSAETPYRIGIILPLTGTNAFGDGIRKGCEIAAEELKDKADQKASIELYFEDDQYNPAKTLTAFRKLIEHDKIDAAITVSTGPTRAILPIADKLKLPVLAIATNDGFTAESKYAFSIWLAPEIEAGAMAKEVIRRGYKKIARVYANNPVFEELNRHFDSQTKQEIEIAFDQGFNPEEIDFRSVVTKIKSIPGIDAVLVGLLPAGAGSFAKQSRALGLKRDLFSAEVFESPEAIKLSGGALEGQWYASNANPSPVFNEKFKELYPDIMIFGAANCYDAINLFAAGIEHGKNDVINFLSTLKDYHGALGNFTVRADHTFSIPAAIRVVKGNGYEEVRVVSEKEMK